MHYLKSFVMTLSLFVLTVPVIQAGDVEDINSMVKKKVSVIFDLLGKQEIEKNERNDRKVLRDGLQSFRMGVGDQKPG